MFKKSSEFVKEVSQEMKKVSWSTRAELTNSTVVVIVTTLLLAIFIGVVDFVLSNIINRVLR